MTLEDFSKSQLESMGRVVKNKPLKDLLEDRVKDIKEDDFSVKVSDVEGMLRREFHRGMAQAYEAVLSIQEAVDEELELRDKEKELAQKKKS